MKLALIVAASEDSEGRNVIGQNGEIPWRAPGHIGKYKRDMDRFRNLTMNNAIIMGRKTADTFSKPLRGRENIILTRNKEYKREGFKVCNFPEQAIEIASGYSINPFVIGGADIYNLFFDMAGTIEFTKIKEKFNGDSYFPKIDPANWKEEGGEDKEFYSFVTYNRIN